MRVAKFIAHSGHCSRREAEKLIYHHRVKINGLICKSCAINVSDEDRITVEGKEVFIQNKIRLWKFYKPLGFITTTKDPENRETIFNLLPKRFPRVISIGRLDINSEGLILFTNNGDLARYFELPKNRMKRSYRARVKGIVSIKKLRSLEKGITINKIRYAPIKARLEKQMSSNAWINMELREGKNREIRKICEFFGWEVNKLIRTQYGKYTIDNLKPGQIKEIENCPQKKEYHD